MNTICASGLLVLALIAGARASGFDDFNHGVAAVNHRDDDLAISLLSRALSGGDLAPELQPVALVDRGQAYVRKHKYSEAIADYDAALKLKPEYYEALARRADAFEATGDLHAAINGCEEMTKVLPNDSRPYFSCGRFYWQVGDYAQASKNLQTALELDPRDQYAFLWLSMSVLRSDDPQSKGRLSEFARRLEPDYWPYSLVDVYLGNGSLERAGQRASDENDETARNRRCEVGFYGGEWELLQGNAAAGRTLLQQAVDLCPEHYIEFAPAKTELKRLGESAEQ